MTLTICIIAQDGIAFASDSRMVSYFTCNDTVKKIFRLDKYTAVGIAGDGTLAEHLLEVISKSLDFTKSISELAERLRILSREKFNDFFSHQVPKDRPSLTLLLAGYTSDSKPAVYRLNSKDNFVPRKGTTGFECVGITILADYLLNRLYEPEIKTIDALKLATFCIKETGTQDYRVGGPTKLAFFSNTKKYTEIAEDDIKKIEKECEQFRILEKAHFYPEDVSSGEEEPKDAVKTSDSDIE